jgi:hypothetical protein
MQQSENDFQRKCADFVDRHVIYCVSTLMYELRAVAEQMDDCRGIPRAHDLGVAAPQDRPYFWMEWCAKR